MRKMPGRKMTPWLSLSLGIILIGAGGFAGYRFLFGRANPPLAKNEIRVGSAAFSVEVASTTVALARGLSFRAGLDQGHGMLFLFGSAGGQSFWMKDMHFPLDMIWIGGNSVLGFTEQIPPPAPGTPFWGLPIYHSPSGTDKVLEVNAGAVRAGNIKVGDVVRLGI